MRHSAASFVAKEGTMNTGFWIEVAIMLLRIFAAGMAG
jgi:hypothetical protein